MKKNLTFILMAAMTMLAVSCDKENNSIIDDPEKEQEQEQKKGTTSLHLDELCFDYQLSKDSVKTWMAENSSLTLVWEEEDRMESWMEFRNETYGMSAEYRYLNIHLNGPEMSTIAFSYENPNMSEEKALSEFEEKWEFTSKLELLEGTEEMAKYGIDYFTYAGRAAIGGKEKVVYFQERENETGITVWEVLII